MDWATKLNIRSEIKNRLISGDTKNDIFKSMTAMYGPDPVIKRILSNIPSQPTQERLKLINNLLLAILICVALFIGYFLVIVLIQKTGSIFLLFPFAMQVLLVYIILSPTRVGYLAVGISSLLQIFNYLKGFQSSISNFRLSCIAITILLVLAIGISSFLYIKSAENWLSPNKANSADTKGREAD